MTEQQQTNEPTEGRSELSGLVSFVAFSCDVMSEHVIVGGKVAGSLSLGSDGKYYFWQGIKVIPLGPDELRAIAARIDAIGS